MKKNKNAETTPQTTDTPTPPEVKEQRELYIADKPIVGKDVKAIQTALIKKGYHCGLEGANGVYNKDTAFAVRMIQSFHGLNVTGKVDAKTAAVIHGE